MSQVIPLSSSHESNQNSMDITPATANDSKAMFKDSPSGKIVKCLIVESKCKQKRSSPSFVTPLNIKKKNVIQKKKTEKAIRNDYFGTRICKENKKKVRLVFVDEVSDQPLIDVEEIESIKNFNVVPMINGGKDLYIRERTTCACVIF